mmetsp:Transcript_22751/g.50605  ORF Transcript_22751/g.50605 Transcript_22751/m.50605 type:complete len:243 (+) Transcript_22751:703-1431(+)
MPHMYAYAYISCALGSDGSVDSSVLALDMSSVSMTRSWLVYTQMSPAIFIARLTTSSADTPGWSSSARAADKAKFPPEPIASAPTGGSSTSPLPVNSKLFFASATSSVASRRRRYLSDLQALASSTHARISCPGCSSSFFSSLSSSVSASAVDPANPTRMSSPILRTFLALPLTTVEPMDTCPSPAITTRPSLRTQRIVVLRDSCFRCSGRRPKLEPTSVLRATLANLTLAMLNMLYALLCR